MGNARQSFSLWSSDRYSSINTTSLRSSSTPLFSERVDILLFKGGDTPNYQEHKEPSCSKLALCLFFSRDKVDPLDQLTEEVGSGRDQLTKVVGTGGDLQAEEVG